MADKQAPKKKRLVKNPETFRERALKAGQASGKPKRSARFKQAGGNFVRPVTRPVTAAASKTAHFKPLRPLFKVLRFIGKILFPAYLRQSWHELRQVTWPGWRESRRLTFAVLVFAVAFGAAVAVIDFGLDRLFRDILLK